MTDYAVICDARHGESYAVHKLALVDRTKERNLWWTSDDPTIVLKYVKHHAAAYAIKRLKFNNPRIVTYEEAIQIISDQQQAILEQVLKNITQSGKNHE